ncbi:TlpA disulfide reductase family protein [uncultured Bacteroides sp.]|uniref:TlpA family protein disulfide reductase n=1 Tax=uncultured Bacteroides sp. TaxID=162156 RepID=UPI0026336A19|nr:TlpA disulfide reductase family protein [uncultured Bacteroides sp.]
MKKLILSLALMFVCFVQVAAQIPSAKVENGKGEIVNTASLVDGKTPMIISFWATTCKPCIRELDAINDLMPDWLDEANFRVIAVATDDNRSASKAKALAEGHGWSDFTVLYDKNQEFMRAMNVTLTPQVYVVDADGKIIYSHTGYTPGSENEYIQKIKSAQK